MLPATQPGDDDHSVDLSALTAIFVPPNIKNMARIEYYHDVAAPQAQQLLPAAFAIVRDNSGRILLVRRADDGCWELPGGRIEVGESASAAVIREVAELISPATMLTDGNFGQHV